MAYFVRIEHFAGPLDLLLKLVESQKLEIDKVSLSEATQPFLEHIDAQRGRIPPEELADFLLVAAKLVYLKSKILLPYLSDDELDEGPDLETQLRMYKAFAEAASAFGRMEAEGRRAFSRSRRMEIAVEAQFVSPIGISASLLKETFERIVRKLEPLLRLPQASLERVVTIEEKIAELKARVDKMFNVSIHKFLSEAANRYEMVVSFLALLELIKQRAVKCEQKELFCDMRIMKHGT